MLCAMTHLARFIPVVLLLSPAVALADPVTLTMMTNVPVGKKPTLTVKANARVVEVVLEMVRAEDEAKLNLKFPSLNGGQSKVIPIGDGGLGASHWNGTLTLTASGESWSSSFAMDTMVTSPIKIGYQRDHLHFDKHVLEFQISRPSKEIEVELTVLGDQGETIGEGKKTFTHAPRSSC